MIALLLAVCVLWTALVRPESRKWLRDGSDAAKAIGGLLAAGVILTSLGSLGGVQPAGKVGAFTTGALVVSAEEHRNYEVAITYVQRSWWGLRVDGRWPARPGDYGSWKYQDDEEKWRSVPWQVYEMADDGGSWSADNRGYHEEQ